MKNNEAIDKNIYREILVRIELDGIIKDITPNCINILGYYREELIGKNIWSLANYKSEDETILNTLSTDIELCLKHKENLNVYMDVSIYNGKDSKDDKPELILSMINITKHIKNEENNKRLFTILNNTKDIIYRYDIYPKKRFVYISNAVEEILGYKAEEHYKDHMIPFKIVHPDDYDILLDKFTGKADYTKPILTRYQRHDGEYIWFEEYATPIYDEEGSFIGVEGICRNIQEKVELEERLRYLSYHDVLTGLYNRAYFEMENERLNTELDCSVGLIIFDLDNLKNINDTYGHAQGDVLIKKAAKLITSSINRGIISRIGGDEFVAILRNVKRSELVRIINNLKVDIEDYNKRNKKIPINISIGYDHSNYSKGVMEYLFKNADISMYQQKRLKS